MVRPATSSTVRALTVLLGLAGCVSDVGALRSPSGVGCARITSSGRGLRYWIGDRRVSPDQFAEALAVDEPARRSFARSRTSENATLIAALVGVGVLVVGAVGTVATLNDATAQRNGEQTAFYSLFGIGGGAALISTIVGMTTSRAQLQRAMDLYNQSIQCSVPNTDRATSAAQRVGDGGLR